MCNTLSFYLFTCWPLYGVSCSGLQASYFCLLAERKHFAECFAEFLNLHGASAPKAPHTLPDMNKTIQIVPLTEARQCHRFVRKNIPSATDNLWMKGLYRNRIFQNFLSIQENLKLPNVYPKCRSNWEKNQNSHHTNLCSTEFWLKSGSCDFGENYQSHEKTNKQTDFMSFMRV